MAMLNTVQLHLLHLSILPPLAWHDGHVALPACRRADRGIQYERQTADTAPSDKDVLRGCLDYPGRTQDHVHHNGGIV